MIIKMFDCDNPKCANTAHPEDGSTTRRQLTPYGWLHITGYRQGLGPSYNVDVCSIECVGPALEDVDRQVYEADHATSVAEPAPTA